MALALLLPPLRHPVFPYSVNSVYGQAETKIKQYSILMSGRGDMYSLHPSLRSTTMKNDHCHHEPMKQSPNQTVTAVNEKAQSAQLEIALIEDEVLF